MRAHPRHYLRNMLTRLEIRILLNPAWSRTTVLHLLRKLNHGAALTNWYANIIVTCKHCSYNQS